MKRMLQLTTDEVERYTCDPEDWKSKVIQFEKVNEVMAELKEGKNTSNWRYILKW